MYKTKPYELTDRDREQFGPWRDKWIANAMSTKPMDDLDRRKMVEAVHGLYKAAKLPPPKHIVFVPSPFTMTYAGGFAAAIWYLRQHGAAQGRTRLARLRAGGDRGHG